MKTDKKKNMEVDKKDTNRMEHDINQPQIIKMLEDIETHRDTPCKKIKHQTTSSKYVIRPH